jgi:hypothetical protein
MLFMKGSQMQFKITTVLPDGMAQMPPFELDWNPNVYSLGSCVEDEFFNDYGTPMPIGTTVTVERVA